jgi:dienelactone hydrolase
VIFAHGSGSSRRSPRNRQVADVLHARGIGTLLFDLLSEAEAEDRHLVFDIPLLSSRLGQAAAWVAAQPEARGRSLGYFGASTGGGAALAAAAAGLAPVAAVVSRGGRPDLAGPALDRVRAPTLLIVGGDDEPVLSLNRAALAQMGPGHRLAVVPGATHLFEEPGALEAVARLAADWFEEKFRDADEG